MTMHHRTAVSSSVEARRLNVDVRKQYSDVSGRVSSDLRQRQSSMLPADSGSLHGPVLDEEMGTALDLQQCQVQSLSRASTPLVEQAPQSSCYSAPERKRTAEFQCHTPCGAAASKRSPFAHPSLQHGPAKLQFSGAAKAASLVVMLVVCCLAVSSFSRAGGSTGLLMRRQLAVSVISVKQQQPLSFAAAGSIQDLAAEGSGVKRCKEGFYSSKAGCTECPGGLTTNLPGAESIISCVAPAGSYLAYTGDSPRAKLCPKGSWSPAFNRLRTCLRCPKGLSTKKTGSTSKSACVSRSSSGGRPYIDPNPPTGGEADNGLSSPSPSPDGLNSSPSPSPAAAHSPSPSHNTDLPIDSEGLGGLDDGPQIEDPPLPPVFLESPSPSVPDVTATELQPEALESSPSPDPSPSPSPRIIDLRGIQVVAQPIDLDEP